MSTMKKSIALLVLLISLIGASSIQSQDQSANSDVPGVVIPRTESHELTSATTDRDYRITVGLPASYASTDETYPTIYVFDPDISFGTVTEFVRLLAPGELPELITVGVGYPDGADIGSLRGQDFGDELGFAAFIRDEVFPLIDSTYRTTPADRAIVGFSLGGDFALAVFASEPTMFKRYISIAPVGLPLPIIMRRADEVQERLSGLSLNVFVAEGSDDQTTEGIEFAEFVEAVGLDGVTVTLSIVDGATHAASLHRALAAGILAVYCGEGVAPYLCGMRVRQGQ